MASVPRVGGDLRLPPAGRHRPETRRAAEERERPPDPAGELGGDPAIRRHEGVSPARRLAVGGLERRAGVFDEARPFQPDEDRRDHREERAPGSRDSRQGDDPFPGFRGEPGELASPRDRDEVGSAAQRLVGGVEAARVVTGERDHEHERLGSDEGGNRPGRDEDQRHADRRGQRGADDLGGDPRRTGAADHDRTGARGSERR